MSIIIIKPPFATILLRHLTILSPQIFSSTSTFGPTKVSHMLLKWEKSWKTIDCVFTEYLPVEYFCLCAVLVCTWCLVFRFAFFALVFHFSFFVIRFLLLCCIKTASMYRIANANKCKVPHPKVHFYFAFRRLFCTFTLFCSGDGVRNCIRLERQVLKIAFYMHL